MQQCRSCSRVREGGEVLQTIELDRASFACALGGPARRTLFMIAQEWKGAENMFAEPRTGQVLMVEAPARGTAGRSSTPAPNRVRSPASDEDKGGHHGPRSGSLVGRATSADGLLVRPRWNDLMMSMMRGERRQTVPRAKARVLAVRREGRGTAEGRSEASPAVTAAPS